MNWPHYKQLRYCPCHLKIFFDGHAKISKCFSVTNFEFFSYRENIEIWRARKQPERNVNIMAKESKLCSQVCRKYCGYFQTVLFDAPNNDVEGELFDIL